MEEIKVTINNDGTLEIDTAGYKGDSCIEELEKITKMLGEYGIDTEQINQKRKPEYYARNRSSVNVGT